MKGFFPLKGLGVFCLVLVSTCLVPAGSVSAFDRRSPVVQAVETAAPAVVNIRTEQVVKRQSSPLFGFADPFFDEFFRYLAPPKVYKTQSLGSGVIIDPKGYILTNAHVIEKASKIYVALTDQGQEREAVLVGQDERIDLAVLQIEGGGPFPALAPARSDDLLVGESVIAIGNPLGLGHSITTGVVSSKRRRIPTGENDFSMFIQTDALINPGNSGGPLININGELIGINTAIIQQAQGIGFAIPIDTARRIIDDLIRLGKVRQAYLGVIPGEVSRTFSQSLGSGGVLIQRIEKGSPADRGGLRPADVILAIDGDVVGTPLEYRSLMRTYTPDDQVHLQVLRGTGELTVPVRLAALPPRYGLSYGERLLGVSLADSRAGLMVQQVVSGSKAERVGLRRGDLLAEIEGERIRNSEDFSRLMEDLLGREPLRCLVVRESRGYYIDLP